MGDEVAFSTSLNRIGGAKKGGEHTNIWVRVTVGFRKIEGRWLVTHEHVSTPFYMDGSLRAAVDLSPDYARSCLTAPRQLEVIVEIKRRLRCDMSTDLSFLCRRKS